MNHVEADRGSLGISTYVDKLFDVLGLPKGALLYDTSMKNIFQKCRGM